jgi:hypothetical protein
MSSLADIYSYSNSGFPAYVSPTPPVDPPNHNIWFNPDTGDLMVWNGSEWVVVCGGCTDNGGGGESPYPAPGSFQSCTYEAVQGQSVFGGVDIFGNTLSGLTEAGTYSLVHVNGVRLQSNDYTVTGDGEITLVRSVAAGSSVIVEAFGLSGAGGSPYPAPSSFLRCTYAGSEGQTAFSGVDIFGNTLAGLSVAGTIAVVHVNGVRIQDNEYSITGDGEITLVRPVAAGSSIIVEAFTVATGGGGGGSPYPAPGAYLRCTYAASTVGQTNFTGIDKFGNDLSSLMAPGAISIVHVNGVRLEDDEYTIVSDSELSLVRGVAVGSSVIVEVMEVAEGSGWGVPPVTPSTAYKIETHRWQFDGVQKSFSVYVDGVLYAPESVTGVFLSLEGVMLDPGIEFMVSGSMLTFSVAPPTDAQCWGIIGIPSTSGVPEHNHDCGVF